VPITGVEPVPPPPGPVTPPAPPEPPEPPEPPGTSTSLEKIDGIGPRLAEKLRDAGIPDVETLVRTKFETLAEILGEERAKAALEAAEKLLAELEE
jgi:predicted flap endonuclease-1-like 5' DNA nuclease